MSAAPNGIAADEVRLTVVIPHFNHTDFLPRALFSVIDQKIAGLEILVVDDGSDPDHQSALDRIAARDASIRVVRHAVNRGAPAALNTGLQEARGKTISFLGADDLALPGLYETMIAALDHDQAALACGEIAILGDDGAVRGLRPVVPPSFRRRYLSPAMVRQRLHRSDNWICNTVTVYQTAAVRDAGGFREELGAFCDGFLVRQIAIEHGLTFVPELFGVWRVAADTLSADTALNDDLNVRQLRAVEEAISTSAIGRAAPEYPAMFVRRVRFSAARMQFVWRGSLTDPEAVWRVSGLGQSDRRTLKAIHSTVGFGLIGRLAAIAWLAVRLRPMSAPLLAISLFRNRLMLWRDKQRIIAEVDRAERHSKMLTGSKEAA